MDNERQAEEENEPPPPPSAGLPYRISSDMNLDGRYEESVLELTKTELRNISGDTVRLRISLEEVDFVLCTEFVGNGLLQAQLRDGRQVPIIRYSKPLSERFEEVEDEINALLKLKDLDPDAGIASGKAPARKAEATYQFKLGPHKGALPPELGARLDLVLDVLADRRMTKDPVVLAEAMCDLLESADAT